jgi:pimeloyl-ACP methyl ester carboxylesterase
MVHGAGGSADLWSPQLDGLSDVARVIAPDLPGHGPLGGPGEPSVAGYAQWLERFVADLEARSVVLVGHSMGGAIAQALALARPDWLDGLVLIATGARLRVMTRLVELLRAQPHEGQSLIQSLAFATRAPRECTDLVDPVLRESEPLVTLGDYLACDRFDVRAQLAEIRTPTLVVTGVEDQLTPLAHGRFLAATIPGGRLVEVPDAGHFPQLEQPGTVNHALRGFLTGGLGASIGGREEAPASPCA